MSAASAPLAPRRRWDPIVLLVVGVALAYLLTNGIMFWVSLRNPTELVSADYYARSKQVNESLAEREASARVGWRVRMEPGDTPGEILVRVADPAGAPVTDAAGTAHAYRPSDAALDQALDWAALPNSPGGYRARFARSAPGLWEIEIVLSSGGRVFRERSRFVAR